MQFKTEQDYSELSGWQYSVSLIAPSTVGQRERELTAGGKTQTIINTWEQFDHKQKR